MMKRVAILGAGGMGTALAILFARTARSVQLWARNPEQAAELGRTRENARHLPGAWLPVNVEVTPNACDATGGANLIVIAIPSAYLRSTLEGLVERIPPGIPVLSVVKGIENSTLARPSQIVTEVLGMRPVAVLSGPSHAEELARGLPASVVVAGEAEGLNREIQDALNQGTFRVYTNPDLIGVELAGALKNILGIAAGVCDGLGFGDNAKAALLTRGLVEISRFGVELGGEFSTFFGLAGVGDMVTTCYSPFGRNRSVGERIGRGERLEEILASMVNVAEGVPTTRSVHDLARNRGVEMPITDELYHVLFEGKSPHAAVTDLMIREPKVEGGR
ncbi:glycerol 3-phosphate dehydrogenase (NAD(P)+) [Singulisphaera sp. GP187]|uniref:NAD(P)H-dependent glycerol-3-phosphate dehydrogenase n=1 Tax=Singulisphaera sp. GP187 TaxID=1882752 RepID=UPI00092C2230|nr:NAD(P)H-dependent glycerol-3-phosphate dehydrogenase [Singulisphaera sp. GP187]SIO60813.1 glycerol 3-phosphate dehydrogenase (NAD(P)+) [Singulisphaera sp. GP187]